MHFNLVKIYRAANILLFLEPIEFYLTENVCSYKFIRDSYGQERVRSTVALRYDRVSP